MRFPETAQFRVAVLTVLIAFSAYASGALAQTCAAPTARVTAVERTPPSTSGTPSLFQIGDRIALTVMNLDELFGNNCGPKVALFLDGQAVKGLSPIRSADASDVLLFDLTPTPESAAVWKHIFANPLKEGWKRPVAFNIGWVDQGTVQAKPLGKEINLFPEGWTFFFLAVLLALLAVFAGLAIASDLLRDPPPPPDTVAVVGNRLDPAQPPPEVGPYSLARTTAGWWLLIIIAAYLFIGLVTRDFMSSLNSTALTLLGISAATAFGGVVISQTKREDQQARARALLRKITELQELKVLSAIAPPGRSAEQSARYGVLANTYPDAARAAATSRGLDSYIERNAADYAIATNQGSQGFLLDILSDADGVSVHRFQLFAWTIVLGIVFVSAVLHDLAMPVFSATMLGLMGVSAGTYLGLKLPEATVPREAPRP